IMDFKFKFEKLIVWQEVMSLGEEINLITKKFRKEEIYNLSSQLCRVVDSIALNISEGRIGQSNLEFNQLDRYAIRSRAEVVTCLHKAIKRDYISKQEFNHLYESSFSLMNKLIAFKKSIK